MKERLIAGLKKWYRDIIAIILITAAVTLLLMHFYELDGHNLEYPLEYYGGDEMSLFATARFIQDSGWNFGTDRIAAPDEYYQNNTDIIAGLHNADVFTTKMFLVLTGGNIAQTVNYVYLSAFYFIAYAAYIVLRLLKVKDWLSAGGALVYAFLPFIFYRRISHIVLSCYYFVPLAVLMAVWVYEDEKFMLPCKEFFKYKRNYAGLLMALLISSSGIGYWQIFSCFFIMVAMLTSWLRTKDLSSLKRGITSILSIILFVFIAIIPEIIQILGSEGGAAKRYRSMADAETYCLKIIQLMLPVNGHGIKPIEYIIDVYNSDVPLVNENSTAYIGIIGVIGLLILLVWVFVSKKDDTVLKRRLSVLSDLNIAAILLSTIGGFGSIIFILGIKMVRGYNRISVFIAFICITAVCLIVNELYGVIKKALWRYVYIAGVSLVMLFAIWEQNPSVSFDFEGSKADWINDKNFFAAVDEVMDKDDMVFQLPYAEYPEGEVQNDMNHMSHFIGYIHSHKLRWSFGTIDESELDIWYENTATLPIDKMITEVSNKGFEGIYINRSAYEEEDWQSLEEGIQLYTENAPIVSENGSLSFYKLK